MSEKRTSWIKFAVFASILVAAYFVNVEVQTYLGEQALEEMQLERHDLAGAFAKAKSENKLVLADLSAIWCPTCRSMDKQVLSDPGVVQAINEGYVFARIEYESPEGEAFMDAYGTRSFPTFLVLSPEGQKLKQLPITTSPEEFAQHL